MLNVMVTGSVSTIETLANIINHASQNLNV